MSFVLCWSVSVTNPLLTGSLSSVSPLCLPPLDLSLLPAPCTLCLPATFQRLHPAILTKPEPHFCYCHPSTISVLFLFAHPLCLSLPPLPPTLNNQFIRHIALDYSSLHPVPLSPSPSSSFPSSPPRLPYLSLLLTPLSTPADSAGISIHRDHMTISPISSPPPPMSSYSLAPFPAKSRPAGAAALATLRGPRVGSEHHAASLLFHAGLGPADIDPCPFHAP